jgi:hypothetical protein
VRSYRRLDLMREPASSNCAILVASLKGQVIVVATGRERESPNALRGFQSVSSTTHFSAAKSIVWGFDWTYSTARQSLCMPHWYGLALCTPLIVTPWISWRLSLRTMLIATTLVAVALGLIV